MFPTELRGHLPTFVHQDVGNNEGFGSRMIMFNSFILQPDAKIDMIMCDLSSLQSVQAAANEYKEKHWYVEILMLKFYQFLNFSMNPIQNNIMSGRKRGKWK